MSLARDDDKTKVDDQERLCRELAARLHWHIATDCGWPNPDGVYQDNNKSAWQEKRKRKGWDTMLADVEAGRINGIVVYHGDRLLRTHEDLLALIHLARSRGVKLASPAGTRDLGSYDDQFILEIEASMAKRESANTSRRRKMQYERWRREGRVRPGGRGGRAYGFATDGMTHMPVETELIRQAANLILEGQPTGQVARWLNDQGARTPTGAEFAHGTVRKMLARPRLAGLMPDGVSRAAWEPVLTRDTWEAVCAMLDSRAAGFSYATNARKYLLSGLATCGACGSGLQIRAERDPSLSGYGCVKPGCRKVQRNARLLDAYIAGAVVERLALETNPGGRVPELPGLAAEFRALAEQRAEIEAALADHTRGHVSLLMARLDSLDARLEQLRKLSGDDATARLRAAHAGISRAEFEGKPLALRRSLVTACVDVVVLPASRRGPGFRVEDVRVTPR